jgi:catechol-2,3-dioxygenase
MRYHVSHLALQVTDLDASTAHVKTTLGLRETFRSDDAVFLSSNDKHHELQLIASDRAGLDHLGFEVESSDDLDRLREQAEASGGVVLSDEPQEAGVGEAVRILGPRDLVFEFTYGMARESSRLEHKLAGVVRKLGHFTLRTEDEEEIVRFAVEGLGMRLSDRYRRTAWLRCDDDHHGVAVGGGFNRTVLHHHAWELAGWDDMRSYLDALALRNESVLWGPGRHGPGHNLYSYARSPEGCLIETYADLQRIPNDDAHELVDWETAHSNPLNLWGPPAPAEYIDAGLPVVASTRRVATRSA